MLGKRRVICAVFTLVACWCGVQVILPDLTHCGPPRRQSAVFSVFRNHMLCVATGLEAFGDLSRNEPRLSEWLASDVGYRIRRVDDEVGRPKAILAYPRDCSVLRGSCVGCIVTLDCASIELPSFALLPDGRVLQNREVGYCDRLAPQSTTMSAFNQHNGWHEIHRYRFDKNGKRVIE